MGGCATKPKVLKADEADAPAPLKDDVVTMSNEKEVTVGEQVIDNDKEIVDDDKESRSLSNLFKENEQKIESSENDEIQSEQIKKEKSSEEKPQVVENVETPTEQTPPLVIDDSIKAETEKTIEAATIIETKKPKTPKEKTQTTEAQTPEEKALTTESQTPEIPEVKKVDGKLDAETQKYETPEEKKIIEEKTVTGTQQPETPEKKGNEKN